MPKKTFQKRLQETKDQCLERGKVWGVYTVGASVGIATVILGAFWFVDAHTSFFVSTYHVSEAVGNVLPSTVERVVEVPEPRLDKEAYDIKMLQISNNGSYEAFLAAQRATTSASSTTAHASSTPKQFLYPVDDAPYPKAGAILPFKRIVAYYGNFYSTRMGALGEYPREEMLRRLLEEKENWEAADPETPVVPAIHYIAVTAQSAPGNEGLYRLRMPDDQIDHALDLADEVDGIVFLDIQVGFSDLMTETQELEKYLALPNVHLGIDPEFAMKTEHPPGKVIGTVSADEINEVAAYLAKLVQEHDLPPKVLVLHRFTQAMITDAEDIAPLPEVQMVIHMDGWGTPERKFGTYNHIVRPEPVQFTGFKVFYKNDLKPPSRGLLTPEELLTLSPQPIYIQYQ